MEPFKNNNEPIFSLHSFGLIWVFITLAILSIGIQYWAEKEHDRREKIKEEQVKNDREEKRIQR